MVNRNYIKELILVFFCGILLGLSFSSFNLGFLAWISFLPLFFALKDKNILEAFFISYLAGLIFFLCTIYWLSFVTFAGMFLLALYLSLYFGLFGALVAFFSGRKVSLKILIIPFAWVGLEYLRATLLSGFGWALLGYSQYLYPLIIQIADIGGAYAVSFLVMLVNLFIYRVICRLLCCARKEEKKLLPVKNYILPVLILFLSLGYGFYRLHTTQQARLAGSPHGVRLSAKPREAVSRQAGRNALKVSVIQGNIPQKLKWDQRAKKYIISKYFNLTQQALSAEPDLIIWPEAALPFILDQEDPEYNKVSQFIKKAKTPVLLGAVRIKDELYYNSAALFSQRGGVLKIYDKLHLVPFGEYIPFPKIFSFLDSVVPIGDFNPGEEYTIFKIQNSFAVLICFEDVFPQLSRQFIKNGADFLVNITNDAWFGRSCSAFQHLQASVFRAVENRSFLIRAANTGVSAFINPRGEIFSAVSKDREKIFIEGYKTEQIFAREGLSFYTRFGDLFVFFGLFLVLYAALQSKKRQTNAEKQRG